MKIPFKKLRKILTFLAIIYRVIAAVIEALSDENPSNSELPKALLNDKKPK